MTETLGRSTTAAQALRGARLDGRTAIITGASAGLGAETARALASAGARVLLAVRDVSRGKAVAASLAASLGAGSGTLEARSLDLADLDSVRAFATEVCSEGTPVHLLINNAGIMGGPLARTRQGFEAQVGTNHLGHMALTQGLMPALAAAGSARVVCVSSSAHRRGRPERLLDSLRGAPFRYTPLGCYGDSKLANILFVRALARRLPPGVEAFALHPGVIPTGLFLRLGAMGSLFLALVRLGGGLTLKSAQQGAATSVYAAVAAELAGRSGAFLADCAVALPSAAAQDDDWAGRVWDASESCLA